MVRPARRALAAVILLLFSVPALAKPPAIVGYVTAIASPTEFDVNGTHIRCTSHTQLQQADAKGDAFTAQSTQDRYLGQSIDVYGKANKKTHTVVANRIVVYPAPSSKLSGNAIISSIPADSAQAAGERTFRADGYLILVTPKTQTTFTAPLTALANVETNVWLKYTGKQRADGVLIADTAVFIKNVVVHSEDKLRSKNEYDPKAVDSSSKQSAISKFALGLNPKRIAPYNDPAMQARIDRIGQSLIPAFQRDLPSNDETKIDFRFQLVDQPNWPDTWALPNGITLVPRTSVERMQNDSQLAELLASDIAYIIEKQTFRQIPTQHKMTAAQAAGAVAGLFVPGLDLATDVANGEASAIVLRHAREQGDRVSLSLLHDAGYDIHEAPKTWWLLAPKKPTPILNTSLPERAAYLYQVLGTTWRSLPATPKSP